MNKTTLIKFSFVFASMAVAIGAGLPQQALARETGTVPVIQTGTVPIIQTGTVPIIKSSASSNFARVKDNGTIPIVIVPSQPDVTAPPTHSPSDTDFSIAITVNEAPTVDTVLTLETSHHNAIGLPSTVVLPAGSTTVTVTASVTPGQYSHHKNVRISVSGNGVTIETKVRVHYENEND